MMENSSAWPTGQYQLWSVMALASACMARWDQMEEGEVALSTWCRRAQVMTVSVSAPELM
jgi:hypothetical protein